MRVVGFTLVEDTYVPEQDKRLVVVSPSGGNESGVLLARASSPEREAHIGNQTGGRVFLFLYTDNFWRDYESLVQKGVAFVREPSEHPYRLVAEFNGLYGNRWDLLQSKREAAASADI